MSTGQWIFQGVVVAPFLLDRMPNDSLLAAVCGKNKEKGVENGG